MKYFNNSKYNKLILGIVLVFIFIASSSLTYAYFSAGITGNENATSQVVTSGTLRLSYIDGPQIIASNISPGWETTKTFSVENTGTVSTTYSIKLMNVNNSILNNEIKISNTSSNGGVSLVNSNACTTDCSLSENIMINPGETHNYSMKIEFIETNQNQNYNQGKAFSATINIVSGNDSELLSYKALEDALVTGAKSYVEENNVVADTYLSSEKIDVEFNEYDYLTESTGVEVEFEDTNATYKPYVATSTGKNSYASSIRTSTSSVSLLGGSISTFNSKYEEPGFISGDGYMVVAKNTQELVAGKNTLLYNVYKDNELIDTLSRVVYLSNDYTDYSISCDGQIVGNNTTINVSSSLTLDEYSVYANNVFSGTSSSDSYVINGKSKNVYINYKDTSGKVLQKQCYIIDSDSPLEVHMIDVGFGGEDSLLIRNDNSSIVIDGGQYGHGSDDTVDYLNSIGLDTVDLLVGSHIDYNHVQAHAPIIDNFDVRNVIYDTDIRQCVENEYCESENVEYILPKLNEKNIDPIIFEDGDEVYYNGFRIKVIGPKEYIKKSDNSNATNMNSMNFIITYKNKKFFFTGDYIQENNILSEYSDDVLNIDFLKHPHHGNINISSSFIDKMSPEVDFVSAHTDYIGTYFSAVKSKLESIGTDIYYSFSSGNVVAYSDGDSITVDENIYPSIYNRNVEHSSTIVNAQSFVNNYQSLGLLSTTHVATVNQNYATTDYRYQGENPNNYLLFNNNQLWRIIGIFETEDGTGSGSKAYRIKLISDESYVIPFDSNGGNSYATSSANTLFNSGDYYNRSGDYLYKGLTSTAKNQIENALWYLSGYYSSSKTPEEMYVYERSNSIFGTNAQTYATKVGMISASDYGYASNLCYTYDVNDESIGNDTCENSNWLAENRYEYTITPYSNSNDYIYGMRTSGHLSYTTTKGGSSYIRPVVYLKSNTNLIGSGTNADPFTIQ